MATNLGALGTLSSFLLLLNAQPPSQVRPLFLPGLSGTFAFESFLGLQNIAELLSTIHLTFTGGGENLKRRLMVTMLPVAGF